MNYLTELRLGAVGLSATATAAVAGSGAAVGAAVGASAAAIGTTEKKGSPVQGNAILQSDALQLLLPTAATNVTSIPLPEECVEEPYNTNQDGHQCEVCLERAKCTLNEPCKHVVTCVKCARELGSQVEPICIKCRTPLTSVVRIYL